MYVCIDVHGCICASTPAQSEACVGGLWTCIYIYIYMCGWAVDVCIDVHGCICASRYGGGLWTCDGSDVGWAVTWVGGGQASPVICKAVGGVESHPVHTRAHAYARMHACACVCMRVHACAPGRAAATAWRASL